MTTRIPPILALDLTRRRREFAQWSHCQEITAGIFDGRGRRCLDERQTASRSVRRRGGKRDALGVGTPNFPRRPALRVQLVEVLFVLEGIHRGGESIVRIREELVGLDEAFERLLYQLFAGTHVVEYLSTKKKKTAGDSQISLHHRLDFTNGSIRVRRHSVKAEIGSHAYEVCDLATVYEPFDDRREMHIGEPVSIVGEKNVLVAQIASYRHQSLADVRIHTGIREGDSPVGDIAI